MGKINGTTKPFNFDYDSEEFYDAIEHFAVNGYTDKEICFELAKKFDSSLAEGTFRNFKFEKDENGNLTARAQKINAALARGREAVNRAARATYIQLALGQRTVKTTTNQRFRMKDGTLTENELVSTTETELPPNMQALSTWLFNHDKEWKQMIIDQKKAMIEAGAGNVANEIPNEIQINVTYNQKEDLELQQKFERQSQE